MPIKPETVAEFFGINTEEFENEDAFREKVAKQWTKTAEAAKDPAVRGQIMGAFNGVMRTRAKQAFGKLEVPADDIDFDATDPPELINALVERASKSWTERTKALEESLKKKGGDEAAKEFQRQLEEASKKIAAYEEANKKIRDEYDGFKTKVQQENDSRESESYWSSAYGEVKLRSSITPLERAGFEAELRKRYRLAKDESGKFYATNDKGERIADAGKHQAFKELPTLMSELAKELKIDEASNPNAGKPVSTTFVPQQSAKPSDGERKPLRQLAPGLR